MSIYGWTINHECMVILLTYSEMKNRKNAVLTLKKKNMILCMFNIKNKNMPPQYKVKSFFLYNYLFLTN